MQPARQRRLLRARQRVHVHALREPVERVLRRRRGRRIEHRDVPERRAELRAARERVVVDEREPRAVGDQRQARVEGGVRAAAAEQERALEPEARRVQGVADEAAATGDVGDDHEHALARGRDAHELRQGAGGDGRVVACAARSRLRRRRPDVVERRRPRALACSSRRTGSRTGPPAR